MRERVLALCSSVQGLDKPAIAAPLQLLQNVQPDQHPRDEIVAAGREAEPAAGEPAYAGDREDLRCAHLDLPDERLLECCPEVPLPFCVQQEGEAFGVRFAD